MARKSMLPYALHWIDEDDKKAVYDALGDEFVTTGPKVAQFEQKVAEYCGAKYAVAVSGATAGLTSACHVAGIGNDDEVITTPITFVASAAAIEHLGGRTILADVQSDTRNIDPSHLPNKVTERTKAIMPVDLGGHPADLDVIVSFAHAHGLVVIEDAAHSLGAEFRGRKVGSIADMTVMSYHPAKSITTGEGGMILTDNQGYADRLREYRHHGIVNRNPDSWEYDVVNVGHNFRLTDVQCALGMSQLTKLDYFIAKRRRIVERYNEAFADLREIVRPTERYYVKSSWHIYVIQLRSELLKMDKTRDIPNASC